MGKITAVIKRTAFIAGNQSMTRFWPVFAGIILLAVFISLQGNLILPPQVIFYLVPGIAILSITAASLFNRTGFIIALAANSLAGVLLYDRYIITGEPAIHVILATLAYSTAGSILISHLKSRELAYRENLEWMSAIDCLTEIYNHRYFQQRLSEELSRVQRNGGDLALAFIDIDNFKPYNDQNGHVLGDRVLKKTAAFFKKQVRVHDVVCRYGGDEFVIILPDTDANNAISLAERLINGYQRQKMPGKVAGNAKLTLSIGISSYPLLGNEKSELIQQADKALYLAKKEGKNRAQVYKENPEQIGDGQVDRKSFDYQSCRHELIHSYRVLMDELAREANSSTAGNLANFSNDYADNTLIMGRALHAGHANLNRDLLAAYVNEIKVH